MNKTAVQAGLKRTNVFRNHVGRATPNNFLSQSKPNVGTYSWQMQVADPSHRTTPFERGTFFVNTGGSGLGAVGVPDFVNYADGNAASNLAEQTGQPNIDVQAINRRIVHARGPFAPIHHAGLNSSIAARSNVPSVKR